jgi:16S rRNA (cytosine1402-N4)-methyltransferase
VSVEGGLSHQPVMLKEAIQALNLRPGAVVVDATFGRGGHSLAILQRLAELDQAQPAGPAGRLIALDRDPQAIAYGGKLNQRQLHLVHSAFDQLGAVLARLGVSRVDAVLADLGVSSPQLDDATRGFSFRLDGPLDMRMDPTQGISARQWLLQASEVEIAKALKDYGEERFAVQVAAAIVARCRDAGSAALQSTGELAGLVAGVIGRRQKGPAMGKDPATRTFQALRILVNQEFAQLKGLLEQAVPVLAPGGRLAVISFHSLEDRMVKQFIARESGRSGYEDRRDPVTGAAVFEHPLRLLDLGKQLPGAVEIKANPRSRSAVLRVAQRQQVPA